MLVTDTGQASEAFKFVQVFNLVRPAPAAYLLVLVGGFLAGLLAGVGVVACIIGVFFTSVLAMAVNGHLYGQAYKVAHGAAPSL